MTSSSSFPQRLTKIDDLTRPDHWYLTAEDDCYFLGEYTARKGFAFSATNQLVLNFKKSPEKRATAQWKYKEQAISQAAAALRVSIKDDWLGIATLVPIPPSKAKDNPFYDDRLVKMLGAIRPKPELDVRELIVQRASMTAVHDQEQRPTSEQLQANYATTGAHYRAAAAVLGQAFPGVKIIGIFIARRVPEAVDIEDFEC